MTPAARPLCTRCGHDVGAHIGAPREPFGAFTADTVCPECGLRFEAGFHHLVGSSSPEGALGGCAGGAVPGRTLLRRIAVSLLHGSGGATVVLHLLAIVGVVMSAKQLRALIGATVISPRAWQVALFAATAVALLLVARFWLSRRRVEPAGERVRRAYAMNRSLVVGPSSVVLNGSPLELSSIRSIRIAEVVRDDSRGTAVCEVSLVVVGMLGVLKSTAPMFVELAAGSAAKTAAAINDTLRGRVGAAAQPSVAWVRTIDGVLASDLASYRPLAFVIITLAPFGFCFVTGLADAVPLIVVAWAVGAAGVSLAMRSAPVKCLWILEADRIVTLTPKSRTERGYSLIGEMLEPGIRTEIERTMLESVMLSDRRGVPFIKLRTYGRGHRSQSLVPHDWLGLDPREFARQLAERYDAKSMGITPKRRVAQVASQTRDC